MSFRLMPSPSSSFPLPHLDHRRQEGVGSTVYPHPYPCLAAGEEGRSEEGRSWLCYPSRVPPTERAPEVDSSSPHVTRI